MDHCGQKRHASQELKHILKLHSEHTNMYLRWVNFLIIIDNVRMEHPRGNLLGLQPAVYCRVGVLSSTFLGVGKILNLRGGRQ